MKPITIEFAYASLAVVGLCVGLATGCTDDPADVAGVYTVAVTNGQNGCDWENFTPGATAQGITMTVTQSGSSVSADFAGTGTGVLLELVLASSEFEGTVDGDEL